MARCIRCDKCGKMMDEVPEKKNDTRHYVNLEVRKSYGEGGHNVVMNEHYQRDLCSRCYAGLMDCLSKYLSDKKEFML